MAFSVLIGFIHPHLAILFRGWLFFSVTWGPSVASEAQILAAYPQLQPDDIRAALAYGAEVARERIVPVPRAAAE